MRLAKVITVDFDHTLRFENGKPNTQTIEQLRDEHPNNRIIIVTARQWCIESAQQIMEFGLEHDLYIDNIIHTDLLPKGPFCKAVGSIRHFDDCQRELKSCQEYGIDTVDCFRADVWAEMYPDPTIFNNWRY